MSLLENNNVSEQETTDFPPGLTPELCALPWEEYIATPTRAIVAGTTGMLWEVRPMLEDCDIPMVLATIQPENSK